MVGLLFSLFLTTFLLLTREGSYSWNDLRVFVVESNLEHVFQVILN